jgi:C1A family cysteine protease
VNWAQINATTHIKSQGQCGSCWAFGAVGIIESYLIIQGKGITDLSEQQLVDCETNSFGCNGGYHHTAFEYANKFGIVAESKYPYKGLQGRCVHKEGPHKIPKI